MRKLPALRLAVLGAGRWGPNLIRSFHRHPDVALRWIVDPDPRRLAALEALYPAASVSPREEEALEDPRIQAVAISTPSSTHYRLVKWALEAGKDVFVEKPLATAHVEALELVELAEARRRKLMVGHTFLFNPGIQHIRERIASGDLGEIGYLHSIRTNLGPIRHDVNALWDLAPHDVSIFRFLMDRRPERVNGFGSSFLHPPVEDVVFSLLHYDRGRMAKLHVSWLEPKKVRRLVVVGSRKMVVFDDMKLRNKVTIIDRTGALAPAPDEVADTPLRFRRSIREGSVEIPRLPQVEPVENECRAFVDWCLRDQAQPSTARFGAEVVEVLEAITRSMGREGQSMELPEQSLRRGFPEGKKAEGTHRLTELTSITKP